MKNSPNHVEEQLQEIWKKHNFSQELATLDGDEIVILDSGVHNSDEAGPDFKNARIRIGNLTYIGDIELDVDYNDWKVHGHNIDNHYNKVVLHTCLKNKFGQGYVYTKDGRKVPSVPLSDFIPKETFESIEKSAVEQVSNKSCQLKCAQLSPSIETYHKKKFVAKLGIERFEKKCERVYNRLKELAYLQDIKIKEPVTRYEFPPEFYEKVFEPEDLKNREIWEQLIYELIFEALGFSKNKSIMLSLAQASDIRFLKKLGNDEELLIRIESSLFNIAGLVPDAAKLPTDETSDYTKQLVKNWEILSRIYDGITFDETKWHFFKLRPQNFPTIRIAGGSRILISILYGHLIETMIKKITEIRNINVLTNSLRSLFVIHSDGFWQNHYVFDQPSKMEIKYFVGASRADEIVINVLLPFFAVYFDVFGKEELSKKILLTYNNYRQNSENKIVREVADCLEMQGFLKKTVFQQGMIELFRNFCSKGRCLECEIGKKVFN